MFDNANGPTPLARRAAVLVLGVRVAYGAGLLVAPSRLTAAWLGPAAGDGPVQVPVRGLGARELVLHGAALADALRGRPLRGWLAASIAGDLTDIAATAAGRHDLPAGAAPKTAAVAGVSALASAWVALTVDR
jgi:hypothetical protein